MIIIVIVSLLNRFICERSKHIGIAMYNESIGNAAPTYSCLLIEQKIGSRKIFALLNEETLAFVEFKDKTSPKWMEATPTCTVPTRYR